MRAEALVALARIGGQLVCTFQELSTLHEMAHRDPLESGSIPSPPPTIPGVAPSRRISCRTSYMNRAAGLVGTLAHTSRGSIHGVRPGSAGGRSGLPPAGSVRAAGATAAAKERPATVRYRTEAPRTSHIFPRVAGRGQAWPEAAVPVPCPCRKASLRQRCWRAQLAGRQGLRFQRRGALARLPWGITAFGPG